VHFLAFQLINQTPSFNEAILLRLAHPVHKVTVPFSDDIVIIMLVVGVDSADVVVVVIVSVAFTTTAVECLVSVAVVSKFVKSTAIVVVIISYHINFIKFV
jgi:hypothetical protein